MKTAWSLAQRIQKLVEGIKHQDQNAKLLVDKFNALTAMLQQTVDLYGQDESSSCDPREQQIRQNIRTIAVDCKEDLEKFEPKLRRLTKHGNWASVAWKQDVAGPAFASMEKSVWERHQILHVQVQSLHTSVPHRYSPIFRLQKANLLRQSQIESNTPHTYSC